MHTSQLWKDMRSSGRTDVLLLAPDRQALSPASRWRPVLRGLLSSLRKQAGDVELLGETVQGLQSQLQVARSKVRVAVPLEHRTAPRYPFFSFVLAAMCPRCSQGRARCDAT